MGSEGQARTGQAETSKVRTGQVRTGQVWTGHIWKVQVGTGQVVQCPPHPHPNCSPNQKQFKLGQVKYVKSSLDRSSWDGRGYSFNVVQCTLLSINIRFFCAVSSPMKSYAFAYLY